MAAALSVAAEIAAAQCLEKWTGRACSSSASSSGNLRSGGRTVQLERRRAAEWSLFCSGCECYHSLSHLRSDFRSFSNLPLLTVFSNGRIRASFQCNERRIFFASIPRRPCRSNGTKCMVTTATSAEGVSVKSLDGDDSRELPSLSNKPVFTMRPPVRRVERDENAVPQLKPNPRPALKLKPRTAESPASEGTRSVQQIFSPPVSEGTRSVQPTSSPPASEATRTVPPTPSQPGTATEKASAVDGERIQGRGIFRPDDAFRAQAAQSKTVVKLRKPTSGDGVEQKVVSKGPILRDVGAAPRPRTGTTAAASPASTGPKFTKTAPPKGKEDWRKKAAANAAEGGRRRVSATRGIASTVDLDTDSPAVGTGRRGGTRKFTKASRKAARVEAARASAPVRVDVLEVGKRGLSVSELAGSLAVNEGEIVKSLFMKGIATVVNQTLDEETVRLVCKEFGVEVVEAGNIRIEDMAKKTTEFLDEEDLDHLVARPPVVTVMGHVDHGKTSLLDYIRKTKVAAGEAGGITQGIGAYQVSVQVGEEEQDCVFLDTPGHQAFSAMRARGARVTDIAVIVVAADDGVRPQTIEAIAHAKAANVPLVIAINKIDKEGANPDRVMQELSTHGVMVEDWGGDVPAVQVSAVTGENVNLLLETLLLVAELQELKANPSRSAKGTVIEACLDRSKGAVATLLVQNGTLQKGDVVLCGESYGKVRALMDDTGAVVSEAGPSMAVQTTGFSTVPVAGEEFEVVRSVDVARERAEERAVALREQRLAALAGEGKVTLSSMANAAATREESGGMEHHQMNLVLKVDAQGSVEAIREALQALPQDTVGLRFLMQAVGDISTSDVDLAVASEAVVLGFNVGLQPGAQVLADKEGVEIRVYKVIYELIDDMRKAMEGLLDVLEDQIIIGQAEVRAVFGSGSGRVAGCMVTEGKLVKGCGVRIVRGKNTVHTCKLESLRRVKEVAKEVPAGLECGIGIEDFTDWQEGDIIEAFNMVPKKRSLEEASISTIEATAAVKNA